jgi:uncharacterized protein (TIGR03437 family)
LLACEVRFDLLKLRFFPFFIALTVAAASLSAQTVRFLTSMGGIDVTLTPSVTPMTVANFMDYVNSGFYSGGNIGGVQYSPTIFTSSSNPNITTPLPPFVIQGGGYALEGVLPVLIPPTFPPVNSEFANLKCPCNIAGTIAAALSAGGDNSAQNQWFFNTQDNSSTLDLQASTVFGSAANAASLAVMTSLNNLPTFAYDAGQDADFTTLPLINYSCPNSTCPLIKADNYVYTFSVAPLVPTTTAAGFADSATALNNVNTGISPGELLTIYGSNLGPCLPSEPLLTGTCTSEVPTLLELNSAGTAVTTSLDGTEVTFNGVAGPMYFTLDGQIAVFVPYEIAGASAVTVVVSYLGIQTKAMQFNVVPATPGLFTLNYSGQGDAAIVRLNSDGTTTLISTSSPASVGDFLEIYGEGYGVATANTSLPDGAVVTTVLPKPAAATAVLIDGQPVSSGNVQYVGGAGDDVNGVMQINLVVPKLAPGPHNLQVQVGSAVSRSGVNLQTM